jgi:hypothetical protein
MLLGITSSRHLIWLSANFACIFSLHCKIRFFFTC